jgi:hypothetical protein
MAKSTREDADGSLLFSNDQGQLHVQIDNCAAKLPGLMAKTREQINNAIADGNVANAQQLSTSLVKLTDEYGSLISYEILIADQSQEMHDAIVGMAKVNKQIAAIMEQTSSRVGFLSVVTPVVNGLNKIIGTAIKKKSTGQAPSG